MHGFRVLALGLLVGCTPPGAPTADRPVSYLGLRFEATVRQQHEFTCGAASLATIFTYYWQVPVSEEQVLAALRDRYSEKQIAKISETGLSFDDLIFVANKFGFAAEGAKIPRDQLAVLAGPVIVHLDAGKLQHFVVLRRVGEGVYYLSDPILGAVAMHADDFAAQYTGNALAVWRASDLPTHTKLETPRDGVRVSDSLWRAINVPLPLFNHGL